MAKNQAAAKMVRYGTYRTPKGIAGFSYLQQPDEKFGKARQRIELFVDKADPEFKKFAQVLKETKAKYLKEIGKPDDGKFPSLKKVDEYHAKRFGEYGVKEGDYMFEFSTNAKQNDDGSYKFVPVFNAANQPSDSLKVFGGDIVRVSVSLSGYNTPTGYGIKAYLNAVQVLEKKNAAGAINPFSDESAEYDITNSAEGEGTAVGEDDAPFEAEEAPAEEAVEEVTAPVTPAPKATTTAAKKGTKATTKPATTPTAAVVATGEVDLTGLL